VRPWWKVEAAEVVKMAAASDARETTLSLQLDAGYSAGAYTRSHFIST